MILLCNSINYFVNSNSSKGYVSLMDSNFADLDKVVRFNGYPSVVMLDIISNICFQARDMGYQTELIHNCLDNSLEGVIVREVGVGIINFPLYSNQVYNIESLLTNAGLKQTKACLQTAWSHFAEALKIHDKWEKIYISNMDFDAANRLAEDTIEDIFKQKESKERGTVYHRYFGAATINGSFDYIENLTSQIGTRYLIKGRPGTGKSTFLKKVAEHALNLGFNTEVYHCAFDPSSIDMVIVREMDMCLFDSTSPHEYYPSRPNDKVIDIYKTAVKEKTDEKYRAEITSVMTEYKSAVAKATKQLGRAKKYYDEVQRVLLTKIDAQELENIESEISNYIFEENK